MMTMSKYGGESSDQEDLVDASGGSDQDDDGITDVDELQFAYDKPSASMLNPTHDVNDCSDSSNSRGGGTSSSSTSTTIVETKLKLALLGIGVCLLVSTFLLLFIHPLYLKQIELGGDSYNAYGSIIFISTIVTTIFVAAAAFASWYCKWTIKFYQFPIPAKG